MAVAFGIAVLSEVVGHLDVQGAVGIGEAFELDVEILAHDAARAFGADQVAALDGLGFAGRVGHLRHDAIGGLAEGGEFGRQGGFDPGMRLHQLERLLHDLDALALQDVGEGGVVLEVGVVELGDQLAPHGGPSSETAGR